MIVISLNKVPPSLRGDLTKWCQEIQTGIYVGNFSAKIRDLLWQRITKNIGSGVATMVYNTNNELGYTFRTTRTDYEVIDLDGIPFMKSLKETAKLSLKHGFSNAYKYHRARKSKSLSTIIHKESKNYVSIDLETTGLDPDKNEIISIAAIKDENNEVKQFYELINIKHNIPTSISKMTKIDNNLLDKDGIDLSVALRELCEFIGNATIIGYNIQFDIQFLVRACQKTNIPILKNKSIDLMGIIKRNDLFLDNYRLSTVLKKYGIKSKGAHNSLWDAQATYELFLKLNKNELI